MKLPGCCRTFAVAAFVVFIIVAAAAQRNFDPDSGSSSANYNSPTPASSVEAVFVGSYRADGKFLPETPEKRPKAKPLLQQNVTVPLQPNLTERVIPDFEPPGHASRPLRGHSALINFRNALIAFAYGREPLLQGPIHVLTDSRGRLIVSDPGRASIHVVDQDERNTFRIEGGSGRRLQAPAGIAIDTNDNIYVADSHRGFVLVYGPDGRFVRYVGKYRGESLFQEPIAVAVDQRASRLYVLDKGANELIVLTLDGHVLMRAGGDRDRSGKVRLNFPTEIAVRDGKAVIVDEGATRIQVLDHNCAPLTAFRIRPVTGPPVFRETGLALDSSSNIYLTNLPGSSVRVYRLDGNMVGSFGHSGQDKEGFSVPSGAWIDAADRIYIADTNNNRVQVLKVVLPTQDGSIHAAESSR